MRTASLGGIEFEMWFRIPLAHAPGGPLDASPFLPPLYLMCMHLGEELAIDAPVSARLLASTSEVSDVCDSFWPERMRPVAVDAPTHDVACAGDGYGCFFSRGVDSWYSVLTDPAFTHLLHLTSFQLPCRRDERRRAIDRAAAALPQRSVHIETNVYEYRPGWLGHQRLTGAYLAAVALATGLARVAIPSTAMRGELGPLGTHPLLDPLFSTERTEVIHHGELSRMQKVRALARFPQAIEQLDVCGVGDQPLNCGECEKCLRTMLELHAAGALDASPCFAAALEPARIAALSGAPRRYWIEALHALGTSPRDRRLAAATQIALLRSDLAQASRRLEQLEAEPGLADHDAMTSAAAAIAAQFASAGAELDRLRECVL